MENGTTAVVADEKELNNTIRSFSLNIQDSDDADIPSVDQDQADIVKSNVKISFHLSLDQSGGANVESRTKKFLESDDAIISQIFSQTITSAGVTPTDEYDDFFTHQQQQNLPSIANKKSVKSEDGDDDDISEEDSSQKLQILNTQQRPSIVIDCFDETPPVTPDEAPEDTGAFYFHQTIVDDDDITELDNAESGVEDCEDEIMDAAAAVVDIPSELLEAVQQYGLSDNFTTIEEDEDILSPTTTEAPEEMIDMKTETTETSDDAQNMMSTEDKSAVHFLSNSNQLVEPEPALKSDNLIADDDDDGWCRGDTKNCNNNSTDNDHELDDTAEESDDSAENNITAKAYSFDDEQTASVETASEEAYEESTEIEIDEFGNEKVSTKSNRTASASIKAKASVETKANGVSTKASVEQSEEKSMSEQTTSQGVNLAVTGSSSPAAIKAADEGGEKTTKRKVIRKKAKKGDETGKENISVHSSIMKFNKICNANVTVVTAATNTGGTKITNGCSGVVVVKNNGSSPSTNNSSNSNVQMCKPTAAVSPSPKIIKVPSPPCSKVSSNNAENNNNGGFFVRPATYYHTFNCSRDKMRKRNVQNYLNGGGGDSTQTPRNTIYELRNNFEKLIGGSDVATNNGGIYSNGKSSIKSFTTTTTTTTIKDNQGGAAVVSNGSTTVMKTNNYTNSNNHHVSHHCNINNNINSNSNGNSNHHHHSHQTLTASFNNHISLIKGSRPDIYLTAGRKKVISLTYGDDLSNIDVKRLADPDEDSE